MEQMIPVTIDGVQVEVPAGSTVLEAAHKANVKYPHPLLPQGHQRDGQLPYLRGGLWRTHPAGCLRAARDPRHGCEDQHARRPGSSTDESGAQF